ncbi:LysR family transcriptional regulator [Ancylobacter sp. Lp-2]|uniref:LysR family transcriptional regulator n=1 Tax=Ancylobacter sp. Lp-2 TaxID=2881339 RepID=UPI001E3D0F93|nr:LysR family transcriptional regulator [Ancylobacter sp. Lp-2]MCB4767871.1 LysR family transcriptional regulator [Ancylobacter sp. Lp-2]
MRIFRAVADCGGITAAENLLGMEKSNISRAIRQLEDRLGEVLCTRGPKGFELTDFGRSVHSAAIMLGDALEVARSEMMRARNAVTGIVRVGIPDNCLSNDECFVNDVLRAYMVQMPEVELHLHILSSELLREALEERRIHLAINSLRLVPQRYENEILFKEHFRLYVKAETPEGAPHLAQLRSRGFSIVLREDEFLSDDWSKSLDWLRNRKVYASGLEAVATLMDSGPFAGFLPTHYCRQLKINQIFQEVNGAADLRYEFPFYLTYERERPRAFAVQSLIRQFLLHPRRVK